ncbi:MAG: LexA family transcriptional regulator [Bacteroidales bacterium]|jgi:transcriptional regulator with XRE-family HTH domain|nr:LexA family transcriptional regulator [Bacteroidota bacterium]MCF8348285.1 LexA family transcriptional regulator [Bacteroidales bacterium]
MYFSNNIKLLRKRRGRTQDEMAFTLKTKRPTLSGYENGVATPNLTALMQFSEYFGIAIDTLVKVDLSTLSESQLTQLERGYDIFIKGGNLRVLATTVDENNEENIELVNEKARAGYAMGYADPEYIRILPTFKLPFLSKQKKYRTFQISGDSMLPIPDGSYVTGEYVQDWNFIRNHHAYIVITHEEGVVFKVAENNIKSHGSLRLHSLNTLYEPFDLTVNQIKEVWKFVNYISAEVPEPNKEKDQMAEELMQLKKQVQAIQMKLNL